MLTLPFRTMGALLVADDDADPLRRWVTAAAPRIARRPDGTPRVRLSTFTRAGNVASDATRVAGRLSIDVDVRPSPEAIVAAGLAPAHVLPFPWLDAELEVRGPELDTLVGTIALAFGEGGVVVDLDAPATDVLAAVLQADTRASLSLTWRGHVRARLPAIEVVATADIDEIRRRTVSVPIRGPAYATVITRSIITASAQIEIKGGTDAALEASLREWACDALVERMENGEPLSVHVTAADVTRMPVALVGTLEDSVRPDERAALREDILLDPDDLLALRVFEVRAVGDLGTAIERADVELEGGGTTARLQLVDGNPRRITVPQGDLQWRRRLVPRGAQALPWSTWAPVPSSTGLVVPATLPATRTIEIVAAGFDFVERWRSVRVEVGIDGRPVTTATLGAQQASVRMDLGSEAVARPVRARIVCTAHSGFVHTHKLDDIDGDELVVRDPFAGAIRTLTILPSGSGWADVATTMVDLRHEDGEQVVRETLPLSRLEDLAQWRVPIGPDAPREIAWRRHTSFRDGRFESTPWQNTDAGVLTLAIAGAPRRVVQLLPIHLAAGTRVRARLTSGDIVREATMADRQPASLELPTGRYRIALAWMLPDGSERTQAERESDDDVVVIPRPPLAQ